MGRGSSLGWAMHTGELTGSGSRHVGGNTRSDHPSRSPPSLNGGLILGMAHCLFVTPPRGHQLESALVLRGFQEEALTWRGVGCREEITNLHRHRDQNCRSQMICLSRLKVNVGSGCPNLHRSFAVGVHTTTRLQTRAA
jgi:hypothetical protein